MNTNSRYDIKILGAGSAGLSVGLFMAKAGFKVLMVSRSDRDIGGDCLNDGCVPSKALIHVAKIIHNGHLSAQFRRNATAPINGRNDNDRDVGIDSGPRANVDFKKVMDYVTEKQEEIRSHENAAWLGQQGIDVLIGSAKFSARNEIDVNDKKYQAKKIVIATGSSPKKLNVPGAELVIFLDNENIFRLEELPEKLLVIGGGPIGVELAQAMSRLGSRVTIVNKQAMILSHDEASVAAILLAKLQDEGIEVLLESHVISFPSATSALIRYGSGLSAELRFDAVLVAVGRELKLDTLGLDKAGIHVKDHKIVKDKLLRTTNKDVFVCGDIAGDLMFSHAAEFHARIIINNLLSPLKKKLNNKHMSWVTFTDPQLATFGLNEHQLQEQHITYRKVEHGFGMDDKAVVSDFQYGKMILYLSKAGWFRKQRILGGTMIAPEAGELIQELILANTNNLSIDVLFDKIYPYPVASRINQQVIVKLKEERLTQGVKRLLRTAFRIFNV